MQVLHLSPDVDSPNGVAAYASAFREQVREAGVQIHQLEASGRSGNGLADVRAYVASAVSLSERWHFDIVHAELGGGSLREFYAVRAVQRARRAPVCLTLHDPPRLVWFPFHIATVREFRVLRASAALLGRWPAKRMETQVLGAAGAAFTLSQLGRDRLLERYGDRTPVHVLPYPATAAPQAQPSRHDGLLVGFYGHWYSSKGLETLVDALAIARARDVPVRAKLYGEPTAAVGRRASGGYRNLVLQRIRARDMGDAIDLPGRIPDHRVIDALRQCDLIVMPYQVTWMVRSLASTSAAMHETLAAGVPVVASDVRALSEHVRDGDNGLLVPQRDAARLADALCRAWREPGLLERLRDGARRSADAYRQPWTGSAAADVYEQLVSGEAHARPSATSLA